MTPSPRQTVKPTDVGVYIWAVVTMVLIGALLVMGILVLRPTWDPLDIMGKVFAVISPTTAAILAFMKSQETHLSVNGRLEAFLSERAKLAHAEGVAQGAAQEQARAAALAPATLSLPAPIAIVPQPGVES